MLVRTTLLATLTLLASGAAGLRAQATAPAPAREPSDTLARSRRMGPGFGFYSFRMPRMTFRAMPRFRLDGGTMGWQNFGRTMRLEGRNFGPDLRLRDRNFARGMMLQERALNRIRDRGMELRQRLESRLREPRMLEPRLRLDRFRIPSRRYRPI